MKLVTIGISCFNVEKYIDFAIKSIINQTYKDWELILIDDGSNDGTLEKLLKYKSEKIKVIADGKNLGLSKRLNQITEQSNSKYICRMDADDIMLPERLEKQIRYMEENPGIDVVGSGAYSIDTNNKIEGLRFGLQSNVSFDVLFYSNYFIHPTVLGKRTWFLKNKYLGGRSEDFELWLRSFNHSKFHNLNQPLLFYREGGIPYLKKAIISNQHVRSVLLVYIKEGYRNAIFSYLLTYLKNLIYLLFDILGFGNYLIQRRNFKLNKLQFDEAQEKLNQSLKETYLFD